AVPAAIRGRAVAVVRATIALGLARRAAIRTAGGLGEAAACVEVLLAAGEREILATVAAGENDIGRHDDGALQEKRKSSADWQAERSDTVGQSTCGRTSQADNADYQSRRV